MAVSGAFDEHSSAIEITDNSVHLQIQQLAKSSLDTLKLSIATKSALRFSTAPSNLNITGTSGVHLYMSPATASYPVKSTPTYGYWSKGIPFYHHIDEGTTPRSYIIRCLPNCQKHSVQGVHYD